MASHNISGNLLTPRINRPPAIWGNVDIYRFVLFLIFSLFVSFLFGCASFHSRPIYPEKSQLAIQARILDRALVRTAFPGLVGTTALDEQKWDLTGLTLLAYVYNSDLAVARAQWQKEQGGVMTSRELPNPAVSVAPGYDTTSDPAVISSWIVGTALELPLGVPWKRGARIDRARYLNDAARLNLIGVAWDVRARVRQAYLDVYAITQERELLLETQSVIESQVDLLQQLVDIGEISNPELTRTQIQLEETRFAIEGTASRLNAAHAELADAIGVTVASLDSVTFSFSEFDGPLPDIPAEAVRHEAMLNNTQLLMALSGYEASQKELEIAVLDQYPGIRLGPGYEYDQGDDKWSVGVSLELPILTRHQGNVVTAEGNRAEKAAVFDGVQTSLINAAESAVSGYRYILRSVKTTDDLYSRISGLAEQQMALQGIGEVSRLDLIDTRLRLMAAAQNRLTARLQAFRAMSDIEDAIQLPCFRASWTLEMLKTEITRDDR